MTLTIEVEPETERALTEKAAQLGLPVERYVAGVLSREAESGNGTARHSAIQRARGLMSGLPGSVDEFLQERRDEAAHEMKGAA